MPDECFFFGQALVCRATNLCTTYRARQETVRIVIRLDFAILQGGETLRRRCPDRIRVELAILRVFGDTTVRRC
ncbi:hypothetical protein AWB64_03653 [Caballeronia sordidicola]|uniref:Uncharacterized protein n=1 Tax=Caballeronia sordidicola TaxID=196367 RepID=A0A158GWQ3_CABSO|nr:hypothetical protein AWB64_03653 [Caballeronia sordidicola]